jgi:hypothetical protein
LVPLRFSGDAAMGGKRSSLRYDIVRNIFPFSRIRGVRKAKQKIVKKKKVQEGQYSKKLIFSSHQFAPIYDIYSASGISVTAPNAFPVNRN